MRASGKSQYEEFESMEKTSENGLDEYIQAVLQKKMQREGINEIIDLEMKNYESNKSKKED